VTERDDAPGSLDIAYLRTEFLERVAHELRGPVGVTSGALDEIELAVGPDAEKLSAYFLMARRGMGRVLRVAERLERTAQLEGAGVQWAMVPTDLRAVTAEAAKETGLLEARRAVSLTVSCSEEPCVASTDARWMRLAIAELVGNAIRFARSGASVHTDSSTDEITITITDDGPGFQGQPPRRFERAADKRGVGLSMSLVAEVVAAHGGRLELDGPRDGDGTGLSGARVVVVLPRSSKGR
jgi:signal transduction histidine kinase